MNKRKDFSPEFKQEAVRLLDAGQKPATEVARELGIRRNQLYKWKEELVKHGAEISGDTILIFLNSQSGLTANSLFS